MSRLGLAACAIAATIACSEPPTAPTVKNQKGPAPEVTLSGSIFQVSADGTRSKIKGLSGTASIEADVASPTDPQRGGFAQITEGRYQISGLPDGRFVKIQSVYVAGLSNYRFCATNTITHGDTTLDVSLFLPGAALPEPSLSGRVFKNVAGQTLPVANAEVYYKSQAFGPDAVEGTDGDGRYSLCGIPPLPGTLYMVCGNDIVPYSRPVDIRTNTVIDIDSTVFHTCLVPGAVGIQRSTFTFLAPSPPFARSSGLPRR